MVASIYMVMILIVLLMAFETIQMYRRARYWESRVEYLEEILYEEFERRDCETAGDDDQEEDPITGHTGIQGGPLGSGPTIGIAGDSSNITEGD